MNKLLLVAVAVSAQAGVSAPTANPLTSGARLHYRPAYV
jgi:hypothetical protein